MRKLIKYEFRKTWFSKLVLLVITAAAEAGFLAGVFLDWNKGLGVGITLLSMCAMIGLFYIGIESLLVFQRDLNTKQSYMLFLTPRSSYQILGAKVIENGCSILLTGLFFTALAVIDWSVAILHIGGFKNLVKTIQEIGVRIHIEINATAREAFWIFLAMLVFWLGMIVVGYLAITLSATVFAGKKFSGFASFGIYLVLVWAASKIFDLLPELDSFYADYGLSMAVSFLLIFLMYALTGWIMERKLSV